MKDIRRVDRDRFDIDEYARYWGKLDVSGIEFASVRNWPLSDADLACLRYMRDIEDHTVEYLRDLLNTSTVNDPEATAFLSLWAAEEYWHGEAIGIFLAHACDLEPREDGNGTERSRIPRRYNRTLRLRLAVGQRRTRRFIIAACSYLVPSFTAVHMAWGAINELTTLTGYQLLSRRSGHPVLTDLLDRIVKQERLHFSFYYWKANEILKDRPLLQGMTRFVLKHFFAPVGVGAKSWDEFYEMADYLIEGNDGKSRMLEIDRRIGELPGLSNFRPIERAMTSRRHRRYAQRAA